MAETDYYRTLGVSPDSEQEVIEAAYRALMRKHHPDTDRSNPDKLKRAREINEAYEILGNRHKREEYNRSRSDSPKVPSTWQASPGNGKQSDGDHHKNPQGRSKRCIDCAEEIQPLARVCRYCGARQDGHTAAEGQTTNVHTHIYTSPPPPPAAAEPEPFLIEPPRKRSGVGLAIIIIVVLIVIWLFNAASGSGAENSDNSDGDIHAAEMNVTDMNASDVPSNLTNASEPTDEDVTTNGQWTAYDQAESGLTAAYEALMRKLPSDERLGLRNSERAWINDRNSACGKETRNACATRMSQIRGVELDKEWVTRFMPTVGQCYSTIVKAVGTRLEGDTDGPSGAGGASISYTDGHYQVDYDSSPGQLGFGVGDPAQICVVSLPQECPVGDHRGIVYKATDLATGHSWTASDSEHDCGGA